MSLKINREPVRYFDKICDSAQEQPVELDYVLPDYYPEIFRIIRCTAEPRVTSWAVNGDRVSYELTACIRIIYCTEGSSKPECIEQKLNYSRTVPLDKSGDNPSVYIKAVADHINCRAVNRRRIDVRGAVTIHICVMGENRTEAVCEAFGDNIQLKKVNCLCPSDIIKLQKRFTISEDFDLGADAPNISCILRSSAEIISTDKKIISNKLAVKGELKITIMYTLSDNNSDIPVKTMQFTLPYSHLIELEGIDDSYDCRILPQVISCDSSPSSDGEHSIDVDILMLADCTAIKTSMYDIACDEYSSSYAATHTCVPVKIEKEPIIADNSFSVSGICKSSDSPFSVVYDAWCSTDKLKTVIVDGKAVIQGTVKLTVFGCTENGDLTVCDTDVAVEENVAAGAGIEQRLLSPEADSRLSFPVSSCVYTITAESTVEVKAEIGIKGWISDCDIINAITDISIDTSAPREKPNDYALRLYFAENGEELWDIAKKYGASISQVIEENELDSSIVKDRKMLLIPVA